MRNKADNSLPETAQAPPASSEPAAPAPPTFHPRDWVPLRDAVLQIISLAGEDRVLGLAIVNRDLRNGLLKGALVAPDGTMTLLSRTDWEHRTVHAPHNPAEGVGVAPYEVGRYFVRRAGLAGSTSPATPATPADRQVAESGSEPAARAGDLMPEPAPESPATPKETRQAASAPRQGRPSPKDTVRTEAQRQLDKDPDSIPRSLKKWGDSLATWLAGQPDETSVNGRTIEGYIRDLHRSAKRKVIKSVK